ncbi:MAG: 16S rRNA (cytosine(967)-C(5))-methyltransferase RsmB [Ruminococcaceae bacterium]|nr:16S rRNA (cytosine(967)-C(5))-methyltransferase RsmB [Oscillospiraceae bacterium]
MHSAREIAYLSLERCEKQKKYSNLEIDATTKKYSLKGAEKGLYVSLVYGVIERRLTLDFIISSLSIRPVDKLDRAVIIPLRLGFYQLMFMDKIPDSAAVDESVKLSVSHANKGLGGFVNAILRSFLRATSGKNIKNLSEILDCEPFKSKLDLLGKYERMSVLYSYPKWLCEHFAVSYSDTEAEKIMSAQNENRSTSFRVNTIKADRDSVLTIINERGINAKKTSFSPFGIICDGGAVSELSDLFESGKIFVQDEASQLASIILGALPDEKIIDCCACPGGKSFSSAILMENRGEIISCDLHQSKLSLIERGAARLGIGIIKTKEADSSKFDEELAGINGCGADRVLCDVPCSGLGVISKKPEVRYKDPSDIERLPEIQRKILYNCSKYVKPGGVLVYSTCTLNPDENENNVKKFLSDNPDFEPCEFSLVSENGQTIESKQGFLTLFTHIHNTDGFFIAKMKRK